MDAVTKIHTDLGFAAVESQLQQVTGIWAALLKLQGRAGQSDREAQAYRQFLTRCIKNLAVNEAELSPEAAMTACADYMLHLEQQLELHRVYTLEYLRGGLRWEAWMAKFFPADYERYALAMDACNERQTARRFERLTAALDIVLKTYAEAIDGPPER